MKIEKMEYKGWPNCYRLSNNLIDLVVTTDVGPRIIRYSFPGEDNILAEMPDAVVKTDFGEWKPLGGHRLWLRAHPDFSGDYLSTAGQHHRRHLVVHDRHVS